MRHFLRIVVGGVALLVSAAVHSVAAQSPPPVPAPSESNSWRTVVYPVYAWLPVFGAEVRLPEQPSPPGSGSGGVTIPSAKTSGNLNGAAAARFRIERRRLSLDAQFLWAGLSGSVTVPRFEVSANTSYGQVMGGFAVAPALYVDGGVRHVGVSLTASILTFPEVRWKPDLWEPVIGVTFRPTLGQKVRLMTRADLGGLGSDLHRTASLNASLEWKPARHFLLGGGYGWLHLRVDGTIVTKPVYLRQTLNGPILTLGIPF